MTTGAEALTAALEHHRRGDLARAEPLYRHALAADPGHPEVWFLLGVVCQSLGRPAEAVTCYREAVRLQPHLAEAHNNLGVALDEGGQCQEALACYREAVRLKPDYADALNNLGALHIALGQPDEALACCRQAVRLQPGFAKAHNNLGLALAARGELAEALDCYQEAVRLWPDYAEAHNNRGVALTGLRRLAEAVASCREAMRLRPDYPEAHNNLGVALRYQGRPQEALAHYEEALRLRPGYPEALNNIGDVLQEQGRADEAVPYFLEALRLRPDYPEAHNNRAIAVAAQGKVDEALAGYEEAVRLRPGYVDALNNLGNAYKDQGRLDEAVDCSRRALAVQPGAAAVHSNLLFALHYHPGYDAPAQFAEHQDWARRYAEPLPAAEPHAVPAAPGRRLRVGYVSPDFRAHVVAFFMEPILAAHDHEHFAITCYANVPRPDEVTRRLQGYADRWRSLVGLSDDQAADLIRQDGIDILVDLAGHTGGNRLPVFARKPAPVQVTYLGYVGTTGLPHMDYRFTDAQADPPGMTERYHTEELVRLPEVGLCYRPPAGPEVAGPPAARAGAVTFGSFNNLAKITPQVLALWSRILTALPEARLLLKTGAGGAGDRRVRDALARNGIAPGRVTLVGRTATRDDYLRLYHATDMALDPFPYNGITTTCDALWMGVPVISLAGTSWVSRQGVSVLSHLGLADLIGDTPEAYVAAAVRLAHDLPRLRELRAGLRARMRGSTLMDGPRFTRNLEEAYCRIWGRWRADRG
jgi:predicted O-linked N-acetylglucosamine transferase (SPINDLY family)